MQRVRFFSVACFLATQAIAATYVDNPNFDFGLGDWVTNNGNITSYDEAARNQIIHDQFLSMSGFGYYKLMKSAVNVPLFFTAEVSYDGDKRCSQGVQVEIAEVEDMILWHMCPAWLRWFFFFRPGIIARKSVSLQGSDKWHVISADYPFYKAIEGSALFLLVSPDDPMCGNIQLNYAQVGTDARSLGGRGPREKAWRPELK